MKFKETKYIFLDELVRKINKERGKKKKKKKDSCDFDDVKTKSRKLYKCGRRITVSPSCKPSLTQRGQKENGIYQLASIGAKY